MPWNASNDSTSPCKASTAAFLALRRVYNLLDVCVCVFHTLVCTQAAQLAEITSLLEQLEAVNPLPDPVDHLDQVEGDWKLLFSTISIKVC